MDLILQRIELQTCVARYPVISHDAAHFNNGRIDELRDGTRDRIKTGVVHFLLLLQDHTDVGARKHDGQHDDYEQGHHDHRQQHAYTERFHFCFHGSCTSVPPPG